MSSRARGSASGWPMVGSEGLAAARSRWPTRGSSASASLGLLARWPGGLTMRTAARAVLGARDRVSLPQGCAARARAVGGASRARSPASDRSALGRPDRLGMRSIARLTRVRRWTITSRGGPAALSLSQPAAPGVCAGARPLASLETVGNFLVVHEFGFADERPACQAAHAGSVVGSSLLRGRPWPAGCGLAASSALMAARSRSW